MLIENLPFVWKALLEVINKFRNFGFYFKYNRIADSADCSNIKSSCLWNLFIVYGIINYALKEEMDIDMNLYDLEKWFDSMWYQETMNDLWDVGVKDDKFTLISKMNKTCQIAVKTPVGISERFTMEEIEI